MRVRSTPPAHDLHVFLLPSSTKLFARDLAMNYATGEITDDEYQFALDWLVHEYGRPLAASLASTSLSV